MPTKHQVKFSSKEKSFCPAGGSPCRVCLCVELSSRRVVERDCVRLRVQVRNTVCVRAWCVGASTLVEASWLRAALISAQRCLLPALPLCPPSAMRCATLQHRRQSATLSS